MGQKWIASYRNEKKNVADHLYDWTLIRKIIKKTYSET